MEVDHIFMFSNNHGKEADNLVDFGLTEGSNRIHPGQGTTNRKFYFENFFLEILWVINEQEIQSAITDKAKLWERSQFQKNGHSPYGLCLVNSNSTDVLFEKSEIYQPSYFPKGMSIDIITNDQFPELPWTFRLPYRNVKEANNEPKKHANNIKCLTQTEFEINTKIPKDNFKYYFNNFDKVSFSEGERIHLNLEFDNKVQGKEKEFPELGLTIKY